MTFSTTRIAAPALLAISMMAGLTLLSPTASAQTTAAERGQWMAQMGQSGLRRAYSTGADIGELVNRSVSYQIANRVHALGLPQNPQLRPDDVRSRTDSRVFQSDSLIPLDTDLSRPLFARVLARVATRDEAGWVESRNDRIDLGLLYAPTRDTYIGLGLAGENTGSDIEFVRGTTRTTAFGPRLDAGVVINPTWAVSVRLDHLIASGENKVTVQTAGGPLTIRRDIDTTRQYAKLEAVARYDSIRQSWLPEGAQLRWGTGLQYLVTRYSSQTNSLGQTVQEPFGQRERLATVRTALMLTQNIGSSNLWSVTGEVMVDYEFENNLDFPMSSPVTTTMSLAVARVLGRGKRISMDVQRFQNADRSRVRDNISLIAVIDF